MKTVSEILAEIDWRINDYQGDEVISAMQSLKQFIMSEPYVTIKDGTVCRHTWRTVDNISESTCALCGVILGQECEHEWDFDVVYTSHPAQYKCKKCHAYKFCHEIR